MKSTDLQNHIVFERIESYCRGWQHPWFFTLTGIEESNMNLVDNRWFPRLRGFFVGCLLLVSILPVFGSNILEDQVKAAFLYNFTNFIEWPEQVWPNNDAPIVISIVGNDGFAGLLEKTVSGRKSQGRGFRVQRYATWPGWTAPIRVSHLLYIEDSTVAKPETIAADLGGAAVLVVGNGPEFARRGGMIQFLRQGDRVVFEINRRVTEAHGMKISSRLFQVSKIIEDLPGRTK